MLGYIYSVYCKARVSCVVAMSEQNLESSNSLYLKISRMHRRFPWSSAKMTFCKAIIFEDCKTSKLAALIDSSLYETNKYITYAYNKYILLMMIKFSPRYGSTVQWSCNCALEIFITTEIFRIRLRSYMSEPAFQGHYRKQALGSIISDKFL